MKGSTKPFKIKVSIPIQGTTRQERDGCSARRGHALFHATAENVYVALLTDSDASAW